MPSKYEERKNRELQAKEQERRIRRARRTGLNQIVEKPKYDESAWSNLQDSTILTTKSSNTSLPAAKSASPVTRKPRPKSNDWSIRSESKENKETGSQENQSQLKDDRQVLVDALAGFDAAKQDKKARLAEKKRLLAEKQAQRRQQFEGSSSDEEDTEEQPGEVSEQPAEKEPDQMKKPKPILPTTTTISGSNPGQNDTVVSSFSPRIESTPKPSFTKASFTPTLESTKSVNSLSAEKTKTIAKRPDETKVIRRSPRNSTVDQPGTSTFDVDQNTQDLGPKPATFEATQVVHKARKSTHRKSNESTQSVQTPKSPRKSATFDIEPNEPAETTKVVKRNKKAVNEETKVIEKTRKKTRGAKLSRKSSVETAKSSEVFDNEATITRKRRSESPVVSEDDAPEQNEHFESVNFELTKSESEEEPAKPPSPKRKSKKRRSSVRFARENQTREISAEDQQIEQNSEQPTEEVDSDKENRRRTLDRRGAKKTEKRKLKKSDFLASKTVDDELQKQKQLYMQQCVVLPDENPEGLRRSNRIRFKPDEFGLERAHKIVPMLTEKDIKKGNFRFNDFHLDKYSFGGLDNKIANRKQNQQKLKKLSPRDKKSAKATQNIINNLNETELHMVVDDLANELEFKTRHGPADFKVFINNEAVPLKDMMTGEVVENMSDGSQAMKSRRILIQTYMHLGNITKGLMHFGSKAIKETSNASTTTIFEVVNGAFKVTLNDQPRIVPAGMHFFVLVDNEYEIENISKSAATLNFVMTREEIEDPEKTIVMGEQKSRSKINLEDNSLFDDDADSTEPSKSQQVDDNVSDASSDVEPTAEESDSV